MIPSNRIYDLEDELEFRTSRSGGKGGQHANKAETKVELIFDIMQSGRLNREEKKLLLNRLDSRTTKDGKLIIVSEANRSQHQNKEAVIRKFHELIRKASRRPRKRIKTRRPARANEDRLKKKKEKGEKKKLRKPPDTQ